MISSELMNYISCYQEGMKYCCTQSNPFLKSLAFKVNSRFIVDIFYYFKDQRKHSVTKLLKTVKLLIKIQ